MLADGMREERAMVDFKCVPPTTTRNKKKTLFPICCEAYVPHIS